MKTNSKLSAYILRGSTTALLFSCVIVALCSAINLPEQPHKARPPRGNTVFGANGHESGTLSFAERVAYQRAIEGVYWRHRIWPKERSDSKPSLDAVMSQAQLEKKVADYMRESQTLEHYWQRPITPRQLQAEMDRMAQHTKQPQVLREIFQSLGDDASVVAECLARPLLAHRLLTELNDVDHVKTTTVAWRKEPMAKQTADYTLPVITSPAGGCTDDTWTPSSLTNAPSPREFHTGVWTGSEMIVWGGFDGSSYFNTGGRYNPTTDSWTATSTTNAPTGRKESHRS